MVAVQFNTQCLESYRQFIAVRNLPRYRIRGTVADVPDEYASRIGIAPATMSVAEYEPSPFLFDYQRAICEIAVRKEKYALFVDCGFGKWLMICEFVRHAQQVTPGRALIVMPKLCIDQQLAEVKRFYGDSLPMEYVPTGDVGEWLKGDSPAIGITNYEVFKNELEPGNLTCLALDESSTLASNYGKYARGCISLGKGVRWKLSATGTPAPNDRIEYAAQAVFLDQARTANEFLAKYFINRGQTQNRWELKPHAIKPFYKDLSHWSIFLSDPAVYGWQDNCGTIPPIHVHIDEVDMTDEQRQAVFKLTGKLMVSSVGGIGERSKLGQIAKATGEYAGIATNKPAYIQSLVEKHADESIIIWCKYNDEQSNLVAMLPECESIDGSTPHEKRVAIIERFKTGQTRVIVSKPEIMGYGLNLQICTRMIFSGLEDSYLKYYQAVKRANRVGSTKPLDVHIPVTEIEEPMIETVLRKAAMVQADTEEQQQLFRGMRDECLAENVS